jgi:hypothetical protein
MKASETLGAGPPVPKKETSPAGHRGRKTVKKLTNQKLPDSLAVVNTDRELLESQAGVSLIKVSSGRQTRYEVEFGSNRWSFNLLFPAVGKFERLAAKGGETCAE